MENPEPALRVKEPPAQKEEPPIIVVAGFGLTETV